MALKDLLKAADADRYTQDGRDELNEALQADVEDRTYKTGEISQKTGLQKQPDGSWAPPKETKYGKVQQNKEGKWGVQQKLGKGSQFIEHKNEKEAGKALANYTAGYNTTERSKQDPHSNEARQAKQWNKETEKIAKGNKAERRAEHAAQFQKPAESNPGNYPGWKPNKVEKVDNSNRPYRIEGTQFYFETPEEAQTAVLAKGRGGEKTYARPSKDAKINEIQNELGFNLDTAYGGKHSMDNFIKKTGEDEYDINLWTVGTNTGNTLITPLDESVGGKPNAKLKKEGDTWKVLFTERNGGEQYEITKEGRTKISEEDKSEMRISSFMDKYLKGKSNRESNNFYDFVKRKIYQSGEEPQKYLGQSGYSYPTQKLKEYLNEWQSQDAAPRKLTGDCKIRVRKA